MRGKSIHFDDKKINESNFYENKKIFNIYDSDVNKTLVLNFSLDIMMMISLDHYV